MLKGKTIINAWYYFRKKIINLKGNISFFINLSFSAYQILL